MRALVKLLVAAAVVVLSTNAALAVMAKTTTDVTLQTGPAAQAAGAPPAIPVYPPYPYKAGHYPTADAYYALPPYADINPNFYSWRYFLMAQERNRYRYVPHIFHRSEAQRYE